MLKEITSPIVGHRIKAPQSDLINTADAGIIGIKGVVADEADIDRAGLQDGDVYLIGLEMKYWSAAEERFITPEPVSDIDPLTLRIERRPEGALEAVSEKITYNDMEGRQRVYVLVSFIPVDGVVDGKPVTIERPIEFFVPSGQLSSEHQWITATMRSLSLAARGGYITQALQDLRKVAWDKGPVRCGLNQYGKPLFHDSVVAAIAWSIQQILYRRGFVTEDGQQVPLEQLMTRREPSVVTTPQLETIKDRPTPSLPPYAVVGAATPSAGECSECGSDMQMMDGCPTCLTCGNSRCG